MGRALKRNLLRKFNTFARTVLSIGAHQGDSFTCSVGFCGAVWFMANPFDSVFKYFKLLVVLMVGDVMVVDGVPHASQKKKKKYLEFFFSNPTEELDERQPLRVCSPQFTATI